MARRRSAAQERELVEEVTLDRYLAQHRAVPHLFPLDPAAAGDDVEDMVSALASIVRARGDRETDVCLLADNGERQFGLAQGLADLLRCDVYLTPSGAIIRYLHIRTPATGDIWEAMALDAASGQPVDWLVVRPAGLPSTAATWFTSEQGLLRRSRGLVTVALPDGVAFATRATYRDTARLAARLLPSGHALTTIALNADQGLFEIARFEDEPVPAPPAPPRQRRFGAKSKPVPADHTPPRPATRLHGGQLAELIRGILPTIHADVQVALTWPVDAAACTTLHTELLALAESLDRTVWVPEPPGAAFVQPGFGEFVAVDEVGSPSRWRAYPPPSRAGLTTQFGTDLDGRLTPLGEVSATRFGGVRFVSVPPAQLEHLRSWYAAIAPPPGLFPIDLAVLPDGRLGIMLAHGACVVAGPRELRGMLREAGWLGEDLLLLAQPPAHVWNTTIEHARGIVEGLRTDLWLPTLGAEVWVQPDGTLAADAPGGADTAWCCVAFGRNAANVSLPAALSAPRHPRPAMMSRPELLAAPSTPSPAPFDYETGDLAGHLATLPAAPVSPGLPALAPAPQARPEPVAMPGATTGASSPALGRSLGLDAPHGIAWLPASPARVSRAMDLYLWTPLAGDRTEGWTLPSADLFLLAGVDPLRLAEHRPTGYLLRLHVPERGAVDLAEHLRNAPAAVQERVAQTGATHLLPLAWLRDLQVTARFDLDGSGGVRARTAITTGQLAIRFEGAEHGVAGLPNEAVHWPDRGSRADALCYLLLPDESRMSLEIVHGGFVALSRNKPHLPDGHRLIAVRVRRRKAIDVPATLDALAGMNVVGRVHDFVGLDLLLPEADLEHAVVTKIWRRGPGQRVSVDKLGGQTLYEALLDESILSGQREPALSAA